MDLGELLVGLIPQPQLAVSSDEDLGRDGARSRADGGNLAEDRLVRGFLMSYSIRMNVNF